MEALLLIALLMVAVDGPIIPSELSQDIQKESWLRTRVQAHPHGAVVQRSTCGLVVGIRLPMTCWISVSLWASDQCIEGQLVEGDWIAYFITFHVI